MRPDQWQLFKAAAKRQNQNGPIPLALIVDSPWIPTYAGVGHWDYFFDVETWFQANLKLAEDFPDVILFPSWWVEYGMAIEPSSMGARLTFLPDQTPVKYQPCPWKKNALRHSYISYRVAEVQDVPKVALEAGNSGQMIFQHYRELVQAKDAKEWFGIMPA